MNMKKILCVILCICMLFTTEMLTFVASAVEFLPTFNFSGIKDAINALVGYHGDIVVIYCYDPQNASADVDSNLPDPMNIVIGAGETTFNETFLVRSLVGYKASYVTQVELSADDTPEERNAKLLNYNDDGVGIDNETNLLKFNLNNVDSNNQLIYYVYYTAADVNYTVRYYFQDTVGDGYTEITALSLSDKAKTGSVFSDEALASMIDDNPNLPENFEQGYKLLHAIPDMVAADGSTVFQVYFDREYYSMNFNLVDGFGVDQIYERYGANITIGVPTKPGYTFNGWYELTVDSDSDGIPDQKANDAPLLNAANLPKTIGVQNRYYLADWIINAGATSYVIAYWAKEENGHQYLLGTKTVTDATAGVEVDGKDDLKADNVCGLASHQHTADCGGCNHTHTYSCISDRDFNGTTVSGNDKAVIDALENGNYEDGCIYAIQNTTDRPPDYAERYWLKLYINGQWYQPSGAVYANNMSNYVAGESLGEAWAGTFSVKKYYIKDSLLNCGHVHNESCYTYTCGLEEHVHDSSCTLNVTHLVYDYADQNVIIEGDGTTVINVYYHHKEYTLRFFYARSHEEGEDTIYEVVGGTTYYFGAYAGTYDPEDAWKSVPDLLMQTPPYNQDNNEGQLYQWGQVKNQPNLITEYIDNSDLKTKYKLKEDTLEANGYIYYYFEFVAPFGADISEIWPVDKFEPVEIAEKHNHSNHTNSQDPTANCKWEKAYFSAWNGQKGVKYSEVNSNQTIKGAYQYLDEYLVFDDSIPGYADDTIVSYLCYWVNGSNISWSYPREFAYDIYLEVDASDQQDLQAAYPTNNNELVTYQGESYRRKDGIWYRLFKEFSVFDNSDYDQKENQTKISIDGYEWVTTLTYNNGEKREDDDVPIYHYHFYYHLITHQTITFKNEGVEIHTVTNEPFGSLLKDSLVDFDWDLSKNFATYYPTTLEPGAYVFKGWCSTSPCSDATIVDLNTFTIPEEDVILHAYWVKNTYTVKFYESLNGDLLYQFGGDGNENVKIPHGTMIGSTKDNNALTVEDPTRDNDHFIGWFYVDGMTRKKYDPDHTPIKGDMEIFAVWEGTTPRDYTVNYVYEENGSTIQIADPTTGVARENSTKTFVAKAGSALYSQYQTNYFPISQSHSIVIGESGNEYAFKYFHVDGELEYIIRYVDAATGARLPINGSLADGTEIVDGEAKVKTTSSYVVHSYFPYTDESDPNNIKYYTPDSYKKSLVLSIKQNDQGDYVSDTEKNVIEFEYTLQEQPTGYYVVNFYTEKLGNTAATLNTGNCDLHSSIEEAVPYIYQAVQYIPATKTVELPQILGFTYNNTVTTSDNKISFEVTVEGVEINLFYKRNSYNYDIEIHYLQNNAEKVKPIKSNLIAKYGEKVTYELTEADKKLVSGYRPINTVGSVTITENEASNVIVFNYEPIQYNIRYVAVTFVGGDKKDIGTLGGYTSPEAENKLYTSGAQTFNGSTANANEYFEFVGWYKEEECENLITTDAKYVPSVNDLSEVEVNTFYAKFERKTGSLTIERSFDGIDETHVFVYKITNTADSNTLYVTASFSNPTVRIEGLLQGEYTVEQVTDWSWRYGSNNTKVVSLNNNEVTIAFANTPTNQAWLNSNSQIFKNIFGAVN